MWNAWGLLAAEAPVEAGVSDQLIVMIGGIAVAAIGAIATVLVALVNSRSKTTPSPPPPSDGGHVVYERLAVLERRADDADERDEVQDRRLDQVEDVLDVDNPRWAHLRDRMGRREAGSDG